MAARFIKAVFSLICIKVRLKEIIKAERKEDLLMTHKETKKEKGPQNEKRTKPDVTNNEEVKKHTSKGIIKGTE